MTQPKNDPSTLRKSKVRPRDAAVANDAGPVKGSPSPVNRPNAGAPTDCCDPKPATRNPAERTNAPSQSLPPTTPKGAVSDLPTPTQSLGIRQVQGEEDAAIQAQSDVSGRTRPGDGPLGDPASRNTTPERESDDGNTSAGFGPAPHDPQSPGRRDPIQPNRPAPTQPSRVVEPTVGSNPSDPERSRRSSTPE